MFPAYAERLDALFKRVVLWGGRDDKVPTADEFASEIEELLFLCKTADPRCESAVYLRAADHLKRSAEIAGKVLA